MQKGTVSFMTMQGFSQIIITFTSDAEGQKKFFKRETKDKIIFSGDETEAYYCDNCNKLISITEL